MSRDGPTHTPASRALRTILPTRALDSRSPSQMRPFNLMLERESLACSAKGAMRRWMHARIDQARQQRARSKAFLRQAAVSRDRMQRSITAWGLCASFAQVGLDLVPCIGLKISLEE